MITAMRALVGVFGLAFLCLFPMVLAYLILLHNMFRILADRHSATYQELGSPTLFLNNNIRNSFRFQKFLISQEYKDLNDQALTKLGNIGRIMTVIGIIVFIGFLVSYIAYGVIVGAPPATSPRLR
jgi:hypothetical protein